MTCYLITETRVSTLYRANLSCDLDEAVNVVRRLNMYGDASITAELQNLAELKLINGNFVVHLME